MTGAAPPPAAARTGTLAARTARFGAGMRAVLERDFLVLTSGGKFVLLRTIVLLVLAGLTVVILWTMHRTAGISRAGADSFGRAVFAGFAIAYPILVLLIGPALASGAIAGERSTDTLTLVLAAPVRPFALVLAKFLSRLGALLVPLVGGLPIAAICFLYGGISASLFLAWLAVVLALAVMAVAASVLASSYARSVATAILGAYFAAVVLPFLESWGALYLFHEVYGKLPPRALQTAFPWLADHFVWLSEHTAGNALYTVMDAVFGRGTTTGSVAPFLVSTAACALVALLLAGARLSREASAMAAGGPRRGRVRTQRFANPVLGRALQTLPFRRGGWASAASVLVVGGLTWLPAMVEFEKSTVVAGLHICTWTTFFVVLSRASQMIATERQQGSLPVLLATCLTRGQIIRGKVFGLGALTATLLLPGMALGIAGVALEGVDRAVPVLWLGSSAVVLLFFAALGLRVSARAKSAGKAAGLAFALAVGGMVLHGLFIGAIAIASRSADGDLLIPISMADPPAIVSCLTHAPSGSMTSDDGKTVAWAVFWSVVYLVGAFALLGSASAGLEESTE